MYFILLFLFSFVSYDSNREFASSSFREFVLRTTIFNTIRYRINCSFVK